MSPNHRRAWSIPLTLRVVVLRLLLITAMTVAIFYIPNLVIDEDNRSRLELALFVVLPLLMVIHHVLRLWPRRYWLVIFELLASLIEVSAAGFVFGLLSFSGIEGAKSDKELEDLPFYVLMTGIALTVAVSSVFMLFFLLWDTVSNRGKDIIRPFDFSAGLCPPGRQWGLIFGRHNTRKLFSTDNLFIRCIRGGVAILCLLAISSLVYYDAFWNPISSAERTAATTLKVIVPPGGNFPSTFRNLVKSQKGMVIHVVLMVPNVSAPDQYPTMNLRLNYPERVDPLDCKSGRNSTAVFAACSLPSLPQLEDDFIDILATIHFSEVPSDSRVYLGMMSSIADTLGNAEPISLGPGSNLHGMSSIAIKNRLVSMKYAIFGIPRHRQFVVVKVHGQATDWLPSLPRDNNTATLRVTMQAQKVIEIEEEHADVSVLDGFSQIGGIWSFTQGVFATVFGSTLLFELFGLKPLSAYGLVHWLRPGRASLEEGSKSFSPEERDRIVKILKYHLMDVEDDEEDPRSSLPSESLGIASHAAHSP